MVSRHLHLERDRLLGEMVDLLGLLDCVLAETVRNPHVSSGDGDVHDDLQPALSAAAGCVRRSYRASLSATVVLPAANVTERQQPRGERQGCGADHLSTGLSDGPRGLDESSLPWSECRRPRRSAGRQVASCDERAAQIVGALFARRAPSARPSCAPGAARRAAVPARRSKQCGPGRSPAGGTRRGSWERARVRRREPRPSRRDRGREGRETSAGRGIRSPLLLEGEDDAAHPSVVGAVPCAPSGPRSSAG